MCTVSHRDCSNAASGDKPIDSDGAFVSCTWPVFNWFDGGQQVKPAPALTGTATAHFHETHKLAPEDNVPGEHFGPRSHAARHTGSRVTHLPPPNFLPRLPPSLGKSCTVPATRCHTRAGFTVAMSQTDGTIAVGSFGDANDKHRYKHGVPYLPDGLATGSVYLYDTNGVKLTKIKAPDGRVLNGFGIYPQSSEAALTTHARSHALSALL